MSGHICDRIVCVKDDRFLIEVSYDQDPSDPRAWAQTKMCVRKHRNYSFPNELGIDFDDLRSDEPYETDGDTVVKTVSQHEMEKFADYYVHHLDCYEHSGISFSLSGQGIQCRFDTSSNVGFIAFPKSSECSEEDRIAIIQGELEAYNRYLSGSILKISVNRIVPLFREDGSVSEKYETEPVEDYEWVGDINDEDEICLNVPEFMKEAVEKSFSETSVWTR